jgi:hypothetical protein
MGQDAHRVILDELSLSNYFHRPEVLSFLMLAEGDNDLLLDG